MGSSDLSFPRRVSLSLFTDDKGFNFKCNVVMDAVSHYINFVMQMRVACDERRFLSLAYRSLSAPRLTSGGALVNFSRPVCSTDRRDCRIMCVSGPTSPPVPYSYFSYESRTDVRQD